MKNENGITLIELLTVMVIFSVVMAGLYSAYSVQLRQGVKEYHAAESNIEVSIARNIIERDFTMAGYGMPEDYSYAVISGFDTANPPKAVEAGDGNPDTLILRGTALGIDSRAAQGWTYMLDSTPTFTVWNDAREDVGNADGVILLEPNTKTLLPQGTDWKFKYSGPVSNVTSIPNNTPYGSPQLGTLVYGLYSTVTGTAATQPFYTVTYSLSAAGNTSPNCAPNTRTLLRAESRKINSTGTPQPILNCVLDFQVALGLATDNSPDGSIDHWDNGGATYAATYTGTTGPATLNKQLKQIRAYVLVQDGVKDPNYTYSNPDKDYAATPTKIRVGDLYLQGGAVGQDFDLNTDSRWLQYRWRVLTFAVTPRNIR
jgi:prepilin-type N-terminal cleavage/methylation domain-containing protein